MSLNKDGRWARRRGWGQEGCWARRLLAGVGAGVRLALTGGWGHLSDDQDLAHKNKVAELEDLLRLHKEKFAHVMETAKGKMQVSGDVRRCGERRCRERVAACCSRCSWEALQDAMDDWRGGALKGAGRVMV